MSNVDDRLNHHDNEIALLKDIVSDLKSSTDANTQQIRELTDTNKENGKQLGELSIKLGTLITQFRTIGYVFVIVYALLNGNVEPLLKTLGG